MKDLKKENGAITMITVVSVLLLISFLMGAYILVANKVKTQKEMVSETKEIYESSSSMDEVYNSYISNDNVIPIYTAEQFLLIGKDKPNVNINGRYYNFKNDENTIYILMNDLKFNESDYTEQMKDWKPIGDNTDLKAKFEGKNHSIEITYADGVKEYNQENNYGS